MIFGLSTTVFAEIGVDEPGIKGVFIDPIADILVDPVQLAEMQTNGRNIDVTGYVGYLSADTKSANPRLEELVVDGEKWDADTSAWVKTNLYTKSGPPSTSTMTNGKSGYEMDYNWTIYGTGTYRVRAIAKFTTTDTEFTADEGFTVELVTPAVTVASMAAPNIAEIILNAEGKPANWTTGKGRDRIMLNLISEVAHKMENGAMFDGFEKSIVEDGKEVVNPKYWNAVLSYMNTLVTGYTFTYSLDNYKADLAAAL